MTRTDFILAIWLAVSWSISPASRTRAQPAAAQMSRPRGLVLLSLLAGGAGLQTFRPAPVRRRCALRMHAEVAVSEWCMSSGREDAAITILEGQDTAQVALPEE